jgi:serine/threonine protein phosphatase PrpC
MSITIDCFGLTDRGQVRHKNEDQFLVADLCKSMTVLQTSLPEEDRTRRFGVHHGKLLLVADGMGGVAGGEVASGVAVQSVTRYVLNTMPWFFRVQDGREEELEGELRTALEACQRSVEAAANGAAFGQHRMGTTLTMAYLLWPRLYVVHAGDSRCYLVRGGRAHQVTRDHTVAQQMVERGLMSPEQAEESRWSHVLWNCIGAGTTTLQPEVYKATLQAGDTVLLCTDGLTKHVSPGRIVELLERAGTTEEVVRRLVDAANAAGGSDNITVVVGRLQIADGTDETAVEGTAYLPAV